MASTDRIQGYSGDLAIKTPCKVATTANTALAGLLTIDGVTLVAGDRVLVKDNTDTTTNGIYIAAAGTWNRAPDFDGVNDVIKGTQVLVTDGTTNANVFFTVSSATPTGIGSSAITFSASTSAAASAVTAAAEADEAAAQGLSATAQADAAALSAAAAAASAAAAAITVQITGTSTTSLALTTGTKTFVTQTGEVWAPGHTATIARTSAPVTTYMVGIVVSYNSGTGDMVVEVSRVVGTGGPYIDWTLSLAVSDSVYSATTAGAVTGTVGAAVAGTTQAAGDATTKIATTAFVDRLRDVASNAQSSAYQLAASDRGGSVDISTGGVTVPKNTTVALAVGTTITITNTGAAAQTITQATDVTLRMAGTTSTGHRTIAGYGVATLRKTATDTWIISGAGLS